MDVMHLLQSRNRCLGRLLDHCARFIAQAEQGDFTGLDRFLARRDATVRAFGLYDRKLSSLLPDVAGTEPGEGERRALIARLAPVLAEREELVRSLLRLDERAFGLIEEEKNRLARELNGAHKTRTQLMKFRSERATDSGETLDRTL
ncbi:MAG: hypothetical protein NDJ89_01980 [Oligoflexia bacterium]|nr:hypothetical protein [Oligoflexia bacterium]